MKFKLFSNKKERGDKVDNTTDFLNPASPETIEDLDKPKEFKQKKNKRKKKSKKNKKVDDSFESVDLEVNKIKEEIKKEEVEKYEEKVEKKEEKENRKDFIQKKKKVEDISLEEEPIEELISQIKEADEEVEEYEREEGKKEEEKKNIKQEDKKNDIKNFNKKEVGLIGKYLKNQDRGEKDEEPDVFSKRKIQEVESKIDRSDLLDKANILEINLVKDQVSVFFDWYKNLAFLFVLVFLCFLFVIEIYLGLSWWQNYNQNANNYEYEDFNLTELSSELRQIKEETNEALVFQDKLNKVAYLLNNHIYWTNFFDYLEDNTLEGVKYTQFSGNLSGEYSLDTIASNYPLIGKQSNKYLESENVSSAVVSSASLQEIKDEENDVVNSFVVFTTDLTINPEIFKK